MRELNYIIEELIYYGTVHLHLDEIDAIYIRNLLLGRLEIPYPYEGKIEKEKIENLQVPDSLIEDLKESLKDKNIEGIDLLIVEIMGLLTPLPSIVIEKVFALEKQQSGTGLDYLFDLQIKNNYIQKTAIDKNIYFKKDYGDNFLEITINLSKPEKNNKEIAQLLNKPMLEKYPKCLLCRENLGYSGRNDHPPRGNLRIVPLTLNHENWFLQYSPYAYFDHHAIIINNEHRNMTINDDTFIKLLEFVNLYPTFFVGSNADLPIVGGSILDHEHYQGGTHLLPMFSSYEREICYHDDKVKISIVNWYNSVIRIEGKNRDEIAEYAKKILHCWRNYSNEEIDIISHSGTNRHNTITPVARKINDIYSLNLILRNNRCNQEHPDGIFHAHKEYHAIKQEGIGLIEAMGLFILPPRLKRQMEYVEEVLTSKDCLDSFYGKYHDLIIHEKMLNDLINQNGRNIASERAKKLIQDYLADACRNILINTAVFKNDQKGQQAFVNFINESLR